MGLKTPLYDTHVREGAKLVDFGGWDMPLHYGSQTRRASCGAPRRRLFDVSHMCAVDLRGARVREFLRFLLANDVGKLRTPGAGLYSCLLREDGGVLDDLIVLLHDRHLVPHGRQRGHARQGSRVDTRPRASLRRERRGARRPRHARGPGTRRRAPRPRHCCPNRAREALLGLPHVSRHGAGRSRVRQLVRRAHRLHGRGRLRDRAAGGGAADLWAALRAQRIRAAGLGARDTLRLEAGMSLYGNDLDESHDPLSSGLGWTVAFDPPGRRVHRPCGARSPAQFA